MWRASYELQRVTVNCIHDGSAAPSAARGRHSLMRQSVQCGHVECAIVMVMSYCYDGISKKDNAIGSVCAFICFHSKF